MGAVPLDEARKIRAAERDVALELDSDSWPPPAVAVDKWTREDDLLWRRVEMERGAGEPKLELEERMLRFPSAPVHGLHRLSQEHVNMGPIESFHSCRILSQPGREDQVSRIFLMHNGLNETENVATYYRLASYLIEQDPLTVCILRPFPGHLTRCPYPGLSETPLDHYLWDGLHLFRQFLRFMIETRWLLSTIAKYSYYHCISGGGLLGESGERSESRLSEQRLATEMRSEWERLHAASGFAVGEHSENSPELPPVPSERAFARAILALRDSLRLDLYPDRDGGVFAQFGAEPELHTLGYSLGGFTAQSVFMSWSFLVASCSTVLSGGAMRELAPTAFAEPEEWETVLHSLRYELDDALMDSRFATSAAGDLVAGMPASRFRYLKRVFYEVFQQEYRGSFQTRLDAFRQRMLFVVGGKDPIVRPQQVLDSGPPDGINMISVGGLGHFIEGAARGKPEEDQHSFWLPEIGQTIGRLAKNAAREHRRTLKRTWLDEDDLVKDPPWRTSSERWPELSRLSVAERLEIEEGGKLANRLYQHALDDMLVRAVGDEEPNGLLFVLKNEPPTFLLDKRTLQLRGAAMYHEDASIIEYVHCVQRRWDVIRRKGRDKICLVLPHNVRTVMEKIDVGMQHPSQSESSGEEIWLPQDPDETWTEMRKFCGTQTADPYGDWIRVFDGSRNGPPRQLPTGSRRVDPEPLNEIARDQFNLGADEVVIPGLPDCWVWMSNQFLGAASDDSLSTAAAISSLGEVAPDYLGKEREREVAEMMRRDLLRIVTISRARYNPRFRGRIVGKPKQAQELLLRVALCVVTSVRFRDFFELEDEG